MAVPSITRKLAVTGTEESCKYFLRVLAKNTYLEKNLRGEVIRTI